ncbi:MAG: hypothetical protein AAF840_00305 [Bacteroidota bacterium]
MNDPQQVLYIPVHLDAICISEKDLENDDEYPIAPPTYTFGALRDIPDPPPQDEDAETENPYLTDGNIPAAFESDTEVLAGVHLHWQFDAAMTHGQAVYRLQEEHLEQLSLYGVPKEGIKKLQKADDLLGHTYLKLADFHNASKKALGTIPWYQYLLDQEALTIDFPSLPTRWLVVRLPAGDAPLQAWFLESDYLDEEDSHSDSDYYSSALIPSPAQPEDDLDDERPFVRYLGRVRALDEDWWTDDEEAERMAPLTAVGYGNPTFCAYARDCHNVFSLLDPMLDEDGDLLAPQTCSYLVAGWYADDDPIGSQDTIGLLERLRKNNWALPGEEDQWEELLAPVKGAVFSGFLRDVRWDPEHAYCQAQEVEGGPQVVIANTTTEAFATLLAQKIDQEPQQGLVPEEWLNALQMGALPKVLASDDPELYYEELAHRDSFTPHSGGHRWQLKSHQTPNTKPGDEQKPRPRLSDDLRQLLADLNAAQYDYDQLLEGFHSRQQDLYAHWYWRAQWKYDPAFWSGGSWRGKISVGDRQEQEEQRNSWIDDLEDQLFYRSIFDDVDTDDPDVNNLGYQAYLLREAMQVVEEKLQALSKALQKRFPQGEYRLEFTNATRFWEAKDPVVLIADTDSPATARTHRRREATTHCRRAMHLLAGDEQWITTVDDLLGSGPNEELKKVFPILAPLLAEAKALQKFSEEDWKKISNETYQPKEAKQAAPAAFAVNAWSSKAKEKDNPWHPVFLEYTIDFTTVTEGRGDNYTEDFLTKPLELDLNEVDLKYKKDAAGKTLETKQTYYQGRVILTQHALGNLQQQIKQLEDNPNSKTLSELLATVKATLPDLEQTAILTQALDGFNTEILARSSGLQLPIFDPYTDPEDLDVAPIRKGIGRQRQHVPVTDDLFNPLRWGLLHLRKLRIIDAFGQYREFAESKILQPQSLDPQRQNLAEGTDFPPLKPEVPFNTGVPRYFHLPPRFAQATRLRFHWLPAQPQEDALFSTASPVCGWVMSNELNDSLMVYDATGQYLGDLYTPNRDRGEVKWLPAFRPSSESAVPAPKDWEDEQLSAFVQGWLKEKAANFNAFCDTTERVLLTIDPQQQREEDANAVLMGRPLALVRAGLHLELKGRPVTNWTQEAFGKYLTQSEDDDNAELPNEDFHRVQVPVRLGDLGQIEDGLVGYFKYEGETVTINNAAFQAEDTAEPLLLSAGDEQAVELLMLVDPRTKVYATSGILPMKSIGLPQEHYQDALARLAFSFRAGPVLSPPGGIALPTPFTEDEAQWEWLTANEETALTPQLPETQAVFRPTPPQLYEGWLRRRKPPKKK